MLTSEYALALTAARYPFRDVSSSDFFTSGPFASECTTMSSAKAALESDTRTLAFEAGRKWRIRVNTVSAGPFASRAASAIGIIEKMVQYVGENAPLTQHLTADEVGVATAFLCSPLASGITGTTLYVDKGYHAMGMAVEQ